MRYFIVGVACASLIACGGGDSTPTPPGPPAPPAPIATITVSSPSGDPITPDKTVQLTATARDSNGQVLNDRELAWSTSTPDFVAVSASGLVTGILPGDAVVSATSEGITGSLAVEVIAPALEKETWFTGHFGTVLNDAAGAPGGSNHGYSFYTAVFELWPMTPTDVQFGWGSWVYPDNRSFTQPLCPVGTTARDHFDWGPTWDGVYQTIEGGVGTWAAARIPAARAKYRINSTPDCYDTQIQTPGWDFNGDRLPADRLGLAQLSNRLLIPPDGLVFTTDGLFGNAWMALPLIPAYMNADGLAIGDRSLALFTNAANFAGAVAFFTPEVWELVHEDDATARGRGHDAQPLNAIFLSLEMGFLAYYTGEADGVRYRRLPRVAFPADGTGAAILAQEPRFYSEAAVWDAFQDWVTNGTVPVAFGEAGAAATLKDDGVSVKFSGDTVNYPAEFHLGAAEVGGVHTLRAQWQADGELEAGVFPEYYKETAPGVWEAIPASEVPRTTWLADQVFETKPSSAYPALDTSTTGPFSSDDWSAGPFTAELSDGSKVDYVWYRFVDQPAIARLNLTAGVLNQLQAFVESFHDNSGTAGITMAPPTTGSLATLDASLIVTPPTGLERGHVPIVIRQYD